MAVNTYNLSHKQGSSIVVRLLVLVLLLLPISLFAQQKHALLIGISDYPQYKISDASWSRIHGANDVRLLSPILSKQGFKVETLTE